MKNVNSQEIYPGKENISKEYLLPLLEKNGIVVINGFLDENQLKNLRAEFEKILSSPENSFIKPFPYSEGKGCVVKREKIDPAVLPETQKIFSSEFMQTIAKGYLKGEFPLNNEIYVVKDVVGSKHHANDLHFDVSRAFKFFIYLKDTDASNGAFACVPGSHHKAQDIRKKYGASISYENRELSRELPYTEKDAVSIDGPAGTLIIFDTDVFHRAGTVSSGERWVMRGHSRLKENIVPMTKPSENKPGLLQRIKRKLTGK
ncbi:MAG: phytanoyl-CoA dioxygenase family protein [Bacteroidota bacterium]